MFFLLWITLYLFIQIEELIIGHEMKFIKSLTHSALINPIFTICGYIDNYDYNDDIHV